MFGFPILELSKSLAYTSEALIRLALTFMDLLKGFNVPGTWRPSIISEEANIKFIET